ncbi:ABC transporter permease [Umezawaea beigongshangensis]|uniref:ABC transporter permease n=1 Tax=Umezawaea beigongshangensis TaxID=2780383 RepID=UPI0018F12A1B|nr:ABC transporter permease [Umezawaea beigongshangensis]
MRGGTLGTAALLRLALRLDRVRLAVWVLAIAGITVGGASSVAELYGTPESRAQLAAGVGGNPAYRAMVGPPFGLGEIGGVVAWRVGFFAALLVAVMSVLLVVRHTRAEEQAGRVELVCAGVVGRRAPLAAGLLLLLGANAVIGLLCALGLLGLGLGAAGASALGLAVAGTGCVFGAVAGLTAQLTENARTASGAASCVLAAAYLLRAVGDSSEATWLSWLSPLGWAQQVRSFADERWEVLALPLVATLVVSAAAFALAARRDVGAGLLPTRPGRASAGGSLRGPLGLAWRLQRGSLVGWTAGAALGGAAVGSVAGGIGDLVADSPQTVRLLEQLGGVGGLVDSYLALATGVLGIVASAYAVQAALRLRVEETDLRAEPVLATGVTRTSWITSHLLPAFGGSALLLTAAGLCAGLVHGIAGGDVAGQLPRVLAGALVQVPGAWFVGGLAVLLFGAVPRLTALAWAALTAFLVIGQLGALLQLPEWLVELSPFTHLPRVPGNEVTAAPLLWVTGIAAVLVVAGVWTFRRRDVG